MIALRNAHLARELAQRAISSRNARLPLSRLQGSPLLLTEPDLGLDSAHGLASLADRLAGESLASLCAAIFGPDGALPDKGTLRFTYISTKPLHPSQKKLVKNDKGWYDFTIKVIPNYEMHSLLRGFGDDLRYFVEE